MRRIPALASVLTLVSLMPGFPAAAQQASLYQAAKILASGGAAGDNFGYAVANSGPTAVVGAHRDDDRGADSGAVYVLRRAAGSPGAWSQVAKVRASDGAAGDHFGYSVAISGVTMVVGAWGADPRGSDSGAAYVFRRRAEAPEVWDEVARLSPADGEAQELFGISVAISGATAVVGAYLDDELGPASGSAYVFRQNAGGPGAWGEVAKLTPSDGIPGAEFGYAVAISGDTALVGAHFDDDLGVASGSAYVFRRDQAVSDGWSEVAKLTSADGAAGDVFAGAVALSGDTAAIGAWRDDDGGEDSGSAYVFERDEGGPDGWGEVAKLTAADGSAGDDFGFSIALSGDTLVVGALSDDDRGLESGSAYAFRRDMGGEEAWGRIAKLTAADGDVGDAFGQAVAISGGTALIGAYADQDLGPLSGSAYAFQATPVDPSLAIAGRCPGAIQLAASGLTPNGQITLYSAREQGEFSIEDGPCIGTPLALDEARALGMVQADAAGGLSMVRRALDPSCGRHLQVVDLTSCAVSNIVQIR